MKKFLLLVPVVVFIACNSANDEAKVESMNTSKDSPAVKVSYPYEIAYSSQFEIGNPELSKMILELWKDWDNGDLSQHKGHFADSLEMYFSDGSKLVGPRDSVVASSMTYRNNYTNVSSRVDAITPLKSDKNENWVCVWGMEKHTDKSGKVDSIYLMETWRFNKNNKVDLLYQFTAKGAKPEEKK